LADIRARLANAECRLLTLTGPGGSGKTRLAIEAASTAEALFPNGAVFIALQPLSNSDLLLPTIAQAVGLSFYGAGDPQAQLFHYLAEKSLLLLLDNFEHLLDGASLISQLLAHNTGVKVLATSRETLNLQEEWLYPVKGMNTPLSTYSTLLEDYEAVRLFVYHARRVQPNFDLASEREAVIRICTIAEGLPLAIELAASWLKGLSATQIAAEMQQSLNFLSTSARNVEERHRSIRAVFDQSWKLLSEEESLTFAKLSVFRGGFSREAAEQVAGASLPLLVAFVEKSLLNKQPLDRWSVHELLRQYGEEKLVSESLIDSVYAVYSSYFANFMQQCEPLLKSAAQLEVQATIERDFDNIRAAWNYALEHEQHGWINQMVEGLYLFGFGRSRIRESIELFQKALETLDKLTDDQPLIGRLLVRRWGYLHWWYEADYSDALNGIRQALQIASDVGNRFELALCNFMQAYALINMQDYAEARPFLNKSLALFHELGEPFYECWVLHRIGYVYTNLGENDQAIEWTEQSLAMARNTPNQVALVNCLYNLGSLYLLTANFIKGVRYCEEALQAALALGHQGQIAHATSLLALGAFWSCDFEATQRFAKQGLQLANESNLMKFHAYPVSLLIAIACLDKDYAEALHLENLGKAYDTDPMGSQLYYWSSSMLACALDDSVTGRLCVGEALRLALREGSFLIEVSLLPSAAYLLATTQPGLATRFLAWAFSSPERTITWVEQWALMTRLQTELQSRLGNAVYQAEWKRGAGMTWESILADMQAEFAAEPTDTPVVQSLLEPLTQRELEVLQLLAIGLTNPQIAERFVIGAGTVKTHTLNIYRKLDVSNRTQAIIRAREIGLISG
jgi:predicted ATPase/DNA-binding CsgD family transcriptional regulator